MNRTLVVAWLTLFLSPVVLAVSFSQTPPPATSSGAGSNVEAAYTLVSSSVASTTSTLTCANIPAGYDSIVVHLYARSSNTGDNSVLMYLNGDTTAGNYHRMKGALSNGAQVTGSGSASANIGDLTLGTTDPRVRSMVTAEIIDYTNTTYFKNVSYTTHDPQTTTATDALLHIGAFVWRSTDAVTSVSFHGVSTHLGTGSACYVFGVNYI